MDKVSKQQPRFIVCKPAGSPAQHGYYGTSERGKDAA